MGIQERYRIKLQLRAIKTARDITSINNAIKEGFTAIIRKVEPSDRIRSKYSVIKNISTGAIETITDYRNGLSHESDGKYITVIDWTYYYPHIFQSPFAAYLIPQDIIIGERVFLEDLIEDYIGATWNQGDTFRLSGCEAIWNGSDLEIKYDPKIYRSDFIG